MKNWTKAVRLARTGQASQSILDCDRIIVPVRRRFDGGLKCMAVQAVRCSLMDCKCIGVWGAALNVKPGCG